MPNAHQALAAPAFGPGLHRGKYGGIDAIHRPTSPAAEPRLPAPGPPAWVLWIVTGAAPDHAGMLGWWLSYVSGDFPSDIFVAAAATPIVSPVAATLLQNSPLRATIGGAGA